MRFLFIIMLQVTECDYQVSFAQKPSDRHVRRSAGSGYARTKFR